ncbi:hypothetical protein E2320_013453 [Naja naja]|nr:hypothetical protein E2320_013453 [Naja naja]
MLGWAFSAFCRRSVWAATGRGYAMPRKVRPGVGTPLKRLQASYGRLNYKPLLPVTTDKNGSVVISVHAKPGSKQNAVTGERFQRGILGQEFNRSDGLHPKILVADLTTDAVSVAIAAPPSEGEANAELCRYLSKVLEVKKSDVVLEKGSKSREKVVKILAPLTPEDVLDKLRKESSS